MPLDAPIRRPPVNHEAEIGLLGAILANNRAYDAVADFLRAEHFADPRHGAIYEAAARVIATGGHANAITLGDHFAAAGTLEQLGGAEYLAKLQAACLSPIFAESYGRTVHDRAMRRRAIDVAALLAESAYSVQLDETAEGIVGRAQAELGALLTESVTTGPEPIAQALKRALAKAEQAHRDGTGIVGVPTLLADLDDVLGGLRPGTMTVIGARPHMGKTDLAINIAARNAEAGRRVAFFQLEMNSEEVAARALARMTGHPAGLMIRGRFQTRQFADFQAAAEAIDWPLFVDETPRLAVAQIQARAKSLEPDLVIVDHLGLIPSDAPGASYRGKVEQTAAVSGALKAMAKHLHCPVLALCQLNREVEKRQDNHRPNLADLRWAGEIEQDADAVLFLYRASYYLDAEPAEKKREDAWKAKRAEVDGQAEIIIAKNRMGTTKAVEVGYHPAKSLFFDVGANAARADQEAMF